MNFNSVLDFIKKNCFLKNKKINYNCFKFEFFKNLFIALVIFILRQYF